MFDIQELYCSYSKNPPVLYVERLRIPQGKLVFLTGKSGSGKSTLIETLGVMNDTCVPNKDTKILFSPTNEQPHRLDKVWENAKTELESLRRKHFSFIFQNTNLMSNFSCGENMMVGLLIEGETEKKAKAKVLDIMKSLSLPADIFDKNVKNISGGQRQRLAFVRAITSNYTVLFGDEPTGNLDEDTAAELMEVLKKQVSENGKTCIVVSHDLNLATTFGDLVIPIIREADSEYSVIKESMIIKREGTMWFTKFDEIVSNPEEYLKALLKNKHAVI